MANQSTLLTAFDEYEGHLTLRFYIVDTYCVTREFIFHFTGEYIDLLSIFTSVSPIQSR